MESEINSLVVIDREGIELIPSRRNSDLNLNQLSIETGEKRIERNADVHKSYSCDTLSIIMSALYCKIIVIIGFSLTVSQSITNLIPSYIYHGFYVYLYGGSVLFILIVCLICIQHKINKKKHNSKNGSIFEEEYGKNYGSFYLRLGACGFGLGSVVYSGLEFVEFLIEERENCREAIEGVKSLLRTLFTLLQLYFIFLKNNKLKHSRYKEILRFCLCHLLSTNISEWLSLIVEETEHEIHHLQYKATNATEACTGKGVLLQNSTSYLFPCTIEYSLICGVTLYEMWKDIRVIQPKEQKNKTKKGMEYNFDCGKSEKGLMMGLIVNSYTLISLIVYFSLRETLTEVAKLSLAACENLIYISSIVVIGVAAYRMRNLPYCIHRFNDKGQLKLGLDISLLLKAQLGVYFYCIFSFIGYYFCTVEKLGDKFGIVEDLVCIIQTTFQTSFILDTWWKRSVKKEDRDSKPGRQEITYLRIINISLWAISITEKNRAELRPVQLNFYGTLGWVLITHVSMPLAIFYRFHSTICLFEIWKNSYRGLHAKPDQEAMF